MLVSQVLCHIILSVLGKRSILVQRAERLQCLLQRNKDQLNETMLNSLINHKILPSYIILNINITIILPSDQRFPLRKLAL